MFGIDWECCEKLCWSFRGGKVTFRFLGVLFLSFLRKSVFVYVCVCVMSIVVFCWVDICMSFQSIFSAAVLVRVLNSLCNVFRFLTSTIELGFFDMIEIFKYFSYWWYGEVILCFIFKPSFIKWSLVSDIHLFADVVICHLTSLFIDLYNIYWRIRFIFPTQTRFFFLICEF